MILPKEMSTIESCETSMSELLMNDELGGITQWYRNTSPSGIAGIEPPLLASRALVQALRSNGFAVIRVDVAPVESERDLFVSLSEACRFPEPVDSWPALEDALCDLVWNRTVPGGLVFIYQHPVMLGWSALSKLIDVMETARAVWASEGRSLLLLLPEERLRARAVSSDVELMLT
jgi:hypothetical protein